MPAEARSAALTDIYRRRLLLIQRAATVAVTSAWLLEATRLDETFEAWLARAERVVTGARRTGAHMSIAYVAGFLASELGAGDDEPVEDDLPPQTPGEVRRALAPALFKVKRSLADGADFPTASMAGRATALRTTSTQVASASDAAISEAIARRSKIRGWRRVTSPRPCGACLGMATGAVMPSDEILRRHPHCGCTKEPVVDGVTERYRRPTGDEVFGRLPEAEQDRLFEGRGGREKAELVRSGGVDLRSLVSFDRQAAADAILTETTLDRLRRLG